MATFTDERVQAIIRGARAFRVVSFPGAPPEAGVQIAVRLLTEAELDGCRLEGQAKLRAFCETRKWDPTTAVDMEPGLVTRWQERQLVWAAFFDAATIGDPTPRRFFPTYRDVEELDATTVTRLHEAYVQHQEWVAPLNRMEPKEVEELVVALGNGRSASAELHRYERSTLARLCISLASALRSKT